MEPIKVEVSIELNLSEDSKKFITALFAGQLQQQSKPQAPKPEAPVAPAEQKSKLTIEDVRKVLASKVNEHRAEIKEKGARVRVNSCADDKRNIYTLVKQGI